MATTFLAIVAAFIICYSLWYVHEIIRAIETVYCTKEDVEDDDYDDYEDDYNDYDQSSPKVETTTTRPDESLTDVICCAQYQLWYYLIIYLSNVLITVNSSINIILYGFSGEKFRREAKAIICNIFVSSKCACLKRSSVNFKQTTNSKPSFKVYPHKIGTETSSIPTNSTRLGTNTLENVNVCNKQ